MPNVPSLDPNPESATVGGRTAALGAIVGGLAVIAGAFGAHALKGRLDAEALQIFETAARYQMYHALALLGTGLAAGRAVSSWCRRAAALFGCGLALFCGSLYVLALGGPHWLGAITPVGGVLFIGGWLCLGIAWIAASRLTSAR